MKKKNLKHLYLFRDKKPEGKFLILVGWLILLGTCDRKSDWPDIGWFMVGHWALIGRLAFCISGALGKLTN